MPSFPPPLLTPFTATNVPQRGQAGKSGYVFGIYGDFMGGRENCRRGERRESVENLYSLTVVKFYRLFFSMLQRRVFQQQVYEFNTCSFFSSYFRILL